MDLKKLKELMIAMNKHCIDRVYIKSDQMEVELEKHMPVGMPIATGMPSICEEESNQESRVDTALTKNSQVKIPSHGKEIIKEHAQESASGKIVRSPIVGTYYSAPSPDSPPFVKVGDIVRRDTVICIIEAMKVMNEIKAGLEGRVKEIFPENASPIEYGSPLVRIED